MNIYEPAGRAREYSPLALNYLKGCAHGCLYCYVPPMLSRFNSAYEHGSVSSPASLQALEKSAKSKQGCGKQILLSFTSDPYSPGESGATRKVLEILNEYGHKVAVLTKNPAAAMRDIDIIAKFGCRFKLGATLTFRSPALSSQWEAGAAAPSERIQALRELADAGVITWASFEPVIAPSESLSLLGEVSEFIDHVKIGKLNNYKGIDRGINWRDFAISAVKIMRGAGMDNRFYVKKDLREAAGELGLSREEADMDYLNL